MAKKIYLSPSSQPENKYAAGNTNEQEQCRKIAVKCVDALDRCGFEAKAGLSGTMQSRTKESNDWGADAHIPIHSNAYNGKVGGFRGFYYQENGNGHKLVAAIANEIQPLTPGTSDGLSSHPELYEVRETNAPCAYLEVGFHDNPTEAQYIIDHTDEIAEAICKGVCKHYGVQYIPPKEEKPAASGKMYRVIIAEKQCGAFRNLDNALRAAREYLENGDDVKITVRDQ